MADLLDIQHLSVVFAADQGEVRAVDDVSFTIRPGETLGLVGESGCGKTVTAMSILRLIPRPPGRFAGGRILFEGRDLLTLPTAELRGIRGQQISMIFQEPMTALSPLHRVGYQLMETLQLHRDISNREARALSLEWLGKVGIADGEERLHAYPFQLSGGMRQRVMIAMALMLHPKLVIADEPTTALDVTIQAQVFDLMRKMKERDTSLLLITHDMGVIWEMCDRVVVMYASRVAEEGPVKELFAQPLHPYTQGLLAAVPRLRGEKRRLAAIPGQVPSPAAYPPGCHFAERCPFVMARCRTEPPPLYALGQGRRVACFLHDPGAQPAAPAASANPTQPA
jgi:peptide/nickel transport system ATP-binding protein/oligopeptide transport system ATP-binding protein